MNGIVQEEDYIFEPLKYEMDEVVRFFVSCSYVQLIAFTV